MPLPLVHYAYRSGLTKYLSTNPATPSWALVTGASDGIGRGLCFELSAAGFNVILHGRNAAKLERVRDELQARDPSRQFRTVTADAATFDGGDIERIVAAVADVSLTVLVNNVGGTGVLSSNFKHFEETTDEEVKRLFSLNVLFPVTLTKALLPRVQGTGRPAVVITCGSMSYIGQPYIASYSATKAALHAWMRGLAAEQAVAESKIEILEVVIGATYTQQFYDDKNFKPGLFMPTGEMMARAIPARVGLGHRSAVGYFWHAVQGVALKVMPNSVVDGVIAKILLPSVEKKSKSSLQ